MRTKPIDMYARSNLISRGQTQVLPFSHLFGEKNEYGETSSACSELFLCHEEDMLWSSHSGTLSKMNSR